MNIRIFKGLIILMGISILGIIAVQLVWMNNALRIRNELFDRSVIEALNNTANRLETIHDLDIINEIEITDTIHWDEEFPLPPGVPLQPSNIVDEDIPSPPKLPKKPKAVAIVKEFKQPKRHTKIELKIDTDIKTPQRYSYQYNTNCDKIIIDNDCSDNDVIVIRTDTVLKNTESLYNLGIVHIDSIVTTLDTFNILRPDISQRIKFKAGRLKNAATKAVQEIRTWGIDEIDSEQVRNVLKQELHNKKVPINFEMGVLKDSSIVFLDESADSMALMSSKYKTILYPHDIFQKNIRLSVFFPDQNNYIFQTINWLLFISLIFSIIILLTFAFSIYYLLKQKRISEMKSDFINNMTHEFKTPIATIAVATDSIVNDKVIGDKEKVKYFTGMIKRENMRMNHQVEDILTIARIDNKDFEFKWEACNLHEMIQDAIQGIILQIEKRGGKIVAKLDSTNPMVTSDKNHCTSIIYNLLDNANKYSPDSPEIYVTTRNTDKGVVVSVSDKGIGMSKSVQGKIFERFYRQTSGNIHNVKGFGLGLSYVKAVIEANKGSISVQSEQGKGSKFTLFLPFMRE